MLLGVAADLAQAPSCCSLEVVFLVLDQDSQEGLDSLGLDYSGGKRLVPGGDEAEGHDGGQTIDGAGSLGVVDEVDEGRDSSSVDDGHSHVVVAFADLSDQSGSVLAHLGVDILEAVEDLGEDLCVYDC